MVKIIKGSGEKPEAPKKSSVILKGSVYEEQQQIKALEAETEAQRRQIISDAKVQASHAQEEALVQGANQAFAEASEQAVQIFQDRAQYCSELKEPMKRLAQEIAKKILGASSALPDQQQDELVNQGIQKMRIRRKLKIQLADPSQLEALTKLPDFEIEADNEVTQGFVRIVTEVGSSLWDENQAVPKLLA
ncbi:MAG: hypothetical protein JKY15_00540 [Deltaproteobacteria bacterium]|nr:hypothetical protein [Deltaproteobacteria bacterium]